MAHTFYVELLTDFTYLVFSDPSFHFILSQVKCFDICFYKLSVRDWSEKNKVAINHFAQHFLWQKSPAGFKIYIIPFLLNICKFLQFHAVLLIVKLHQCSALVATLFGTCKSSRTKTLNIVIWLSMHGVLQ